MKRNDDDLLRLAFGELSAENARAVEARVAGDASAKAELDAFRDIRDGLQRLPPPPPDNLSADRLRAAILDRELREKRRAAPLGWAWVPMVTAAFAAFVVTTRPVAKPDVTIVSNDMLAQIEKIAEPVESFRFSQIQAPVPVKAAPKSVVADATAVARRPVAKKRRTIEPKRSKWADMVALNQDEPEVLPSVETASAPAKEPETMAAPTSAVVEGGPYTGGPESVVLVSSKRDLETGARAGTETEASNVVVGG